MKKADLQDGQVLAYRESRSYGSFWPVLILDTRPSACCASLSPPGWTRLTHG